MQAPVTFQKALSFAGDLTAHLWIFSFAIFPSSWGDLGRRDGKCTTVNGQSTLSTSWEQLRLPSGHHTTPRGFLNPLRSLEGSGPQASACFSSRSLETLWAPLPRMHKRKHMCPNIGLGLSP